MINLADNELLIRCSCGSNEHVAWLIHEPEDSRGNNLKEVDDDWYLSVMLDHFNFWKRLRTGLRYILAPHTIKYGMTAELVLKNADVDALDEFIRKRRNRQEPAAHANV